MIELARDIPVFRADVDRLSDGEPDAILLTEFAGDDRTSSCAELEAARRTDGRSRAFPDARRRGDRSGLPERGAGTCARQGLNIMMSMKGDGKPVSFIEDCAVRLEDLAEYTDRLTQVFDKHGTRRHLVRACLGRLPARPPGAST